MEFKKFFVYPRIPEKLKKLLDLSNNLWFTWNYDALSIFYKIDAETFRRLNTMQKNFFIIFLNQYFKDLRKMKDF